MVVGLLEITAPVRIENLVAMLFGLWLTYFGVDLVKASSTDHGW